MDDSADATKAWNDAQTTIFPSLGLDEKDVLVVREMVRQLMPSVLQLVNFVVEAKVRAEAVPAAYAMLALIAARAIQADAREAYINAEVERIRRETGA